MSQDMDTNLRTRIWRKEFSNSLIQLLNKQKKMLLNRINNTN